MPRKKYGVPLVAAFWIASLVVASSPVSLAIADNYRHARHVHGLSAAHHEHFGSRRPLYGYYSRHGQYVPGAGDRLIYGPGYVFVPGHGILDEDCDLPTSTCLNWYRDVR